MASEPEITRPVFLIGCGRSGSTLVHKILSFHPQVAWPSVFCRIVPSYPVLNRIFLNAASVPVLGPFIVNRTEPNECYPFWEQYRKGFSRPRRDLTGEDVSEGETAHLRRGFARLRTRRRRCLVVKVTGWPRLGFLNRIFERARFVHVKRDGRAVANSLLKMPWWDGGKGPGKWRYGELAPALMTEWERHERSLVALAAIQWKITMEAVAPGRAGIPDERFLEITYEDLCDDPSGTCDRLVDFCQLGRSRDFENAVAGLSFSNANYKWREDLSGEQREILRSVLEESLRAQGYT